MNMRPTSESIRRFVLCGQILIVCVLAATSVGCGGGGGGGSSNPPAVPPTFTSSGTTSAANLVTMTGANSGDTTVDVQVVVGGPTTSTDVHSFVFDILLSDPTVVSLQSTTVGTALSNATALASLQGSRVVVGVTKQGTPGQRIDATSTLVTLRFRTLKRGSTTLRFVGADPSTSAADAAALNSTGTKLTTITFDSAAATINQG